MGPFTLMGIDTIALTLQALLWVAGVLVVGLGLGVATPALVRSHEDRVARHESVRTYYRLTPAH